ncbi:MAG: diaminopimelate epimerase, partial [Candidatus Binatia bacterium]
KFTKMHGLGNDYVYVNGFDVHIADPAALARAVSPRRKGIGSDGLILIRPSSVAAVGMEMYNADGSRGEMCGNGIRCVGKYAWEHGLAREHPLRVETDAGIKMLELEVSDGKVRSVNVDMGEPILDPARIPARFDGPTVIDAPLEVSGEVHRVTCVSMGNPHCVLFLADVGALDLETIGPRFEHHSRFPKRTNTEFVEVLSPREAKMRVWERGSGETAACGTGACAAAVAAALTGRTERRVRIHLLGGELDIEWRGDGHVAMRGEAVEVFTGEIELPA